MDGICVSASALRKKPNSEVRRQKCLHFPVSAAPGDVFSAGQIGYMPIQHQPDSLYKSTDSLTGGLLWASESISLISGEYFLVLLTESKLLSGDGKEKMFQS